MPRDPRRVTRLALAAAATSLVFPLTPARAADLTWSVPTSGRWLDPANWSTGALPTTADSATINSPGSYTITLDDSTQVGPVTLDNPDATLSLLNTPDSHPIFQPTSLTINAGTLTATAANFSSLYYPVTISSPTSTPLAVTNHGRIDLLSNLNSNAAADIIAGTFVNTGVLVAHDPPAPLPGGPDTLPEYHIGGSVFTNTGTIQTGPRALLSLHSYTLNQNAGTIDGRVTLWLGALNYNGGSISPATPVSLYNSTLNIAPTATAGNFVMLGGTLASTTIPAGNTVRTWAERTLITSGPVTNAGHLIVGYYTGTSDPGSPSLALPPGATLTNTGTLELNSPNLRAANLTGSITNQGVVAINAPSTAAPTIVSGSFAQNAGGSLTIEPATSLSLTNSHFYYNGGSVSGTVSLNNSTVHFAPGLANTATGTFAYFPTTSTPHASPFAGDIPSGVTVVHTTGSASFFPLSSFTNAGNLLTSYTTGARPDYSLNSYTGTLTNTGTIGGIVNGVDRGAYLEIDGNLVNTGTIKANFLTVAGSFSPTGPHPSFDQNAGTLDVDNLCLVFHATFNYNGGTLTGKPVGINDSTLNIAPGTDPASFTFYSGNCTLHGTPAPGSTLALDAIVASPFTVSVTADPFTNAGTLSFASTLGPVNSTLTLPNSGTLTNTGTLSVTLGKGGTRTLNAHVTNTGTFSIGPGATLTLVGSLSTTTPLDLQGTLDLRGPLTWSYAPGDPFPADALRSLLAAGHLTDSAADSSRRLAYADTGAAVAVTLALIGDANLDGQITSDDYALLDRAYARSVINAHWSDGDFNYDGAVDASDYLLIDTTLGQAQGLSPALLSTRESQFGPAYVSALLAAVPEPASLSVLLLPTLVGLTRRRTSPKVSS